MNKKINSIQMLRAFAVMLVIYNHSMIICSDGSFSSSAQINFLYLRHWTSIGLDLFFVISGLIMTIVTKSYLKNPKNWFNFFIKRMIRIIPLYWLYSIFVYIERYLLKHPVNHGEIAKTLLFFPVFAAKNVIFPIIGQGWSLSYEMYFYMLIVFFLCFKSKNVFRYLLTILIVLSAIGYFLNPADTLLNFITTPILTEFALGVGAGLLYNFVVSHYAQIKLSSAKYWSVAATIIGLILMLASITFNSDNISSASEVITNNHIAAYRSLIWGIPCCIFLTGILFMELFFNLKIPQILSNIGDASYSGYLIHILVIVTIGKVFEKFGFLNGDVFIVISTLTSIAISLPLYRYLEKPLLDLSHKLAFRHG